nr:hypothetical protein OG999_06250 [Streptomyces sp. NBC_00886]
MVRTSTGTIATACALSATLLVAGCGGDGGKGTKSSGEVFLQPVAAQGPDPFTDSTVTTTTAPPRVTRTPQSTPTRSTSASPGRMRTVSGGTPGLYGGTARSGSCDVERQITYLTADRAKARAFAQAEDISQGAIPGYLRGLTPVVLRADTQVTNHGFRDAQVTGFQSVLQSGTAVLVDNRGVPRVRCACGNPLKAGVASQGGLGDNGRPWSGFRPAEVIVVTPAPQVITNITIINIVDNNWIERPLGHRGPHHDHVVPPPAHVTPTPVPKPSRTSPRPHESGSGVSPGDATPSPSSSASASPSDGRSVAPEKSGTDCTTPTVTDTPTVTATPGATGDAAAEAPSRGATDCPTTVTASPPGTTLTPSQRGTTPGTGTPPTAVPDPSQDQDSPDEIGPPTVPDTPDLPDGGGLVPDDTTTGSIFDSPTDVFGS